MVRVVTVKDMGPEWSTPDGDAHPWQDVQVRDTDYADRPGSGAVTVRIQMNERYAQRIQMTRADARRLFEQLGGYLSGRPVEFEPGRWWAVDAADGTLLAQTSDPDELKEMGLADDPGVTITRVYRAEVAEWREERP